MTAKEYCTSHDAIAYYSGLSGLEIHHRVKVLYSAKGDAYIRIHGYRIPLSDFIRI